MSELILAKHLLPPDFIDLSIGEAHLIKEILNAKFDLSSYQLNYNKELFEYPAPNGYAPLVKFLEDKHNAPVIITNGAKQGLSACFYLLKKLGWNHCSMKTPYWALLPSLAKVNGIELSLLNNPEPKDLAPFLLLAPNNPDGSCDNIENLEYWASEYAKNNLPFIHDAVYFSHIYVPKEYNLKPIGDIQLFSFSKSFGLSGCRVGYIVCRNEKYYSALVEYMEMMTVGVSQISQLFIYDLLVKMDSNHNLFQDFETACASTLKNNKKICLKIDPQILEVPMDIERHPGMFGWFKVGAKANFTKSKINLIPGDLFGGPGMVRINLAWSTDQMQEIVERLNNGYHRR